MKTLSQRLSLISSAVPKGARIADIGTDHAYLPVFLLGNGLISRAIACDIGEKPLEVARKNIEAAAIDGIELRLSDGFAAINEGEIDCAVIAGMGGEVIAGIIERCEWIKNGRYTLILQPTTSPEKLREFLGDNGFSVNAEAACSENGKLYSVMTVHFSGAPVALPPEKLFIGELSPENADSRLYIEKQLSRISRLARDIKNIPNKQAEWKYYSQIEEKLTLLLGGK